MAFAGHQANWLTWSKYLPLSVLASLENPVTWPCLAPSTYVCLCECYICVSACSA